MKSFDLVSSISTKFDDHISKMEVSRASQSESRNTMLQNGKKIVVEGNTKNNKIDSEDGEDTFVGSAKGGVQRDAKLETSLKLGFSPTSQQRGLSMVDIDQNNIKEFDSKNNIKHDVNALGMYKSKGVKGIKEDCERFRLQMKLLKEKADDSRIQEVMVEGLVESFHKNGNENGADVLAFGDANTRKSKNNQFKKNFKLGLNNVVGCRHESNARGKTSQSDVVDLKLEVRKRNNEISLLTENEKSKPLSFYTSISEAEKNGQSNACTEFNAHKRMRPFKHDISYSNTSISSMSSSTSSLSSLPLSYYVQKLKCLTPVPQCPSNPSSNTTRKIDNGDHMFKSSFMNSNSFYDCKLTNPKHDSKNFCNRNRANVTNIEEPLKFQEKDANIDLCPPPNCARSKPNIRLEILACQNMRNSKIMPIRNDSVLVHNNEIEKRMRNAMSPNSVLSFSKEPSHCEHKDLCVDIHKVIQEYSNNYDKKNDIKIKLEEVMDILLKRDKMNDNHILTMLEKKFEKHQLQNDIGILAIKSEIKNLWNEIRDLSKSKLDIQNHPENFDSATKTSKITVDNDQNVLSNENIVLIKEFLNFKQNDMKIEVENMQKFVKKFLKDKAHLEKTWNVANTQGTQERVLIMERVENLSQLYLGGLEEIRSNVSHLNIECRHRMDELEGQWMEFKQNQECFAAKHFSMFAKQIVDDEEEHIKSTLKRDNETIQHQFMTIFATNKTEILNMLKKNLDECLQSADNKLIFVTNSLKQEMENLRTKIEDSNLLGCHEGAECFTKAASMAEKQGEVATRAAAEATVSATKAKEMLDEMRKSFDTEVGNVQRIHLQLQDHLAFHQNMLRSVVSDARRTREELAGEEEQMRLVASSAMAKHSELNELLRKESSVIVEAVSAVQRERDAASQAANEAKFVAMKAGEVLADVSGSFNGEMTKARHVNMQLQEGLEREKERILMEREIALQHSQEVQDRFSGELALAVNNWKHDMNAEIVRAKEVTRGLEEEQRRACTVLEQAALSCPQPDRIQADMEEYILKTQLALDNLAKSVRQLQDAREDKHQRLLVKRQELEQFKRNWQGDLSQLQQTVQVLEERFKESACEQSDFCKRVEVMESMQVDLVRSYDDVRSSTGDLEKTAAIWLPKYEAAAKIVNELSSKVERIDEQFQFTCGGESLMQQIARVAETKVNGMKDMAIATLESRVNELEKSVSQNDSNLSLKLEYIEKTSKGGKDENLPLINDLSQSVEALRRRVEIIAAERNEMVTSGPNPDLSFRIDNLDSRIEHVASATFNNLRLLDKKVEHVTAGVQSSLDGAAVADKKCAALGSELVKVFRMFSSKRDGQGLGNNCQPPKECKEPNMSQLHNRRGDVTERHEFESMSQSISQSISQSTTDGAMDRVQSTPGMPENQHFPPTKTGISPRKIIRKGMHSSVREPLHPKATHSSETQKTPPRSEKDRGSGGFCSSEGGSSVRDGSRGFRDSAERQHKLHGPLNVVEERKPMSDLDGRLTIEKRQAGSANNCQRTNIRLDAGRIHVNVSHRTGSINQSEKRNDLIAVQS